MQTGEYQKARQYIGDMMQFRAEKPGARWIKRRIKLVSRVYGIDINSVNNPPFHSGNPVEALRAQRRVHEEYGSATNRDFQASRVYAWEDRAIGGICSERLTFVQGVQFIEHVWSSLGLLYPPVATRSRSMNHFLTGERIEITFRDNDLKWMLVHEIAHALTSNLDMSICDKHGAQFVGVYVGLARRFLGIDVRYLTDSLDEAGIRYDLAARPVFLDKETA